MDRNAITFRSGLPPGFMPLCTMKNVIPITAVDMQQIATENLLGTGPGIANLTPRRTLSVTHIPSPKSVDVSTISTGSPNARLNVKLLKNIPATISPYHCPKNTLRPNPSISAQDRQLSTVDQT